MSAILSADDLNDFISPGVACIKPVESLPKQRPDQADQYEVAKEGQLPEEGAPAQISLTDCLACSGCVTSAEAVLVSLQSHTEVLTALDSSEKLFVASVSPQVRASIAATYGVPLEHAGHMIEQLLAGPRGLSTGGASRNGFKWVVDTNVMRQASLVLSAEEIESAATDPDQGAIPKRPVLSSACPGWICYAEKTHAHVLPHMSRLKSPQALTGTLIKTVLSSRLAISPDKIWHLALMPCFDKKLEASREELTDIVWRPPGTLEDIPPVRDVDCVITARELLMLADTRGIPLPDLPRQALQYDPFPDPVLNSFLRISSQPSQRFHRDRRKRPQSPEAGTSGGFLNHVLQTQLSLHPHSKLTTTRGRNADVIEYMITSPGAQHPIFKGARYYGSRNITNLVRKLRPPTKPKMPGVRPGLGMKARNVAASSGQSGLDGYAYVEVMACPGGCTNGGGQIKIDDLPSQSVKPATQKEWLAVVDEAYFSMSDESDHGSNDNDGDIEMSDCGDGPDEQARGDEVNGISPSHIKEILDHWQQVTQIPLDKLVTTSYRQVESDVGKIQGAENSRVVELAGRIGGGW